MLSLGAVPMAGFAGFHLGLLELALQAGVAGGGAGMMKRREHGQIGIIQFRLPVDIPRHA